MHKIFGRIYLDVNRTIEIYHSFVVTNKRIDHQMDAAEFYYLFYTVFSKTPSKDQTIHTKNSNDKFTYWKFLNIYLIFLD